MTDEELKDLGNRIGVALLPHHEDLLSAVYKMLDYVGFQEARLRILRNENEALKAVGEVLKKTNLALGDTLGDVEIKFKDILDIEERSLLLETENQALKDEVARLRDEAKGRRTRL